MSGESNDDCSKSTGANDEKATEQGQGQEIYGGSLESGGLKTNVSNVRCKGTS